MKLQSRPPEPTEPPEPELKIDMVKIEEMAKNTVAFRPGEIAVNVVDGMMYGLKLLDYIFDYAVYDISNRQNRKMQVAVLLDRHGPVLTVQVDY